MEKFCEEKQSEDAAANEKIKNELSTDVPAEENENNSDVETVTETNTDSSDSDSDSDSNSDSDSDAEFECTVCNRKFSGYLPFRQHQKGKKHAKAVLKKKKEKKLKKSDKATESDDELLVQEPYAECKVCNKDFYGPESYEQHLKCKKHKQKVLAASILDQVQEDGKINADKLRDMYKSKRKTGDKHEDSGTMKSSALVDETKEFQCKECEKEFSGFIPFTQHIVSKSHAKKVEQNNLLHEVIPESLKEDKTSANSKEDEMTTLCVEDDVLVCKICSTSFSGSENAVVHMKSKKHAKNLDKHVRKLERRKKKSKDVADTNNVESDKKTEDQTLAEQVLPTSSGSATHEVLDNATSSSSKNEQELVAYEKYKEYKKIMNALPKDQHMK